MGKQLYLPESSGDTLFAFLGAGGAIAIYLAAINVLALLVYGWDKLCAKRRGARRVPEKALFLLALLGGSVGAIAGMYLFRHKTRHWYFRYGLPLILLAQLALCAWLCFK